MNELQLQQWRVERLRAAVDKIAAGNRTSFGKRLGYKDGAFVRQMLSGDRAVTEKTIRTVEAMPGMANWFALEGTMTSGTHRITAPVEKSEVQTFTDIAERIETPILDVQQIDEFVRELKQAFHEGDLTPARFALLQGLLREGRESLASNFTREKQAVGGRKREQNRKQRTG